MLDKLFFVKSSSASDPFRLMLVDVNWYLSFFKEVSNALESVARTAAIANTLPESVPPNPETSTS